MQTEINSPEAIERLIQLGKSLGDVRTIAGAEPFVIIPEKFKLESLAALLPPTRIKQNVVLLESGSFIDYVNRFKSEQTLIFADVTDTGAKFKAVLDYHGAAPDLKAAYCAHIATFECIPTLEWIVWMKSNGVRMDQVQFATFLEDNIKLIQDPPGADLLELIQNLEGKSDVRFTTAVRLQSGGNKLDYDEDVQLKGNITTKPGAIELPQTIVAGISPFQGTEAYEVKARLKFRIESRKLGLWYETIAQHRIVRDAVLAVTKQIADKTSIIPLIGKL